MSLILLAANKHPDAIQSAFVRQVASAMVGRYSATLPDTPERLKGISDLGSKHIGLGIPIDFVTESTSKQSKE